MILQLTAIMIDMFLPHYFIMPKIITKAELAQHKDAKSIWIAIHDKVYDITKFLEEVSYTFKR